MSHSLRLSEDSCTGCVNCLKSCPTEAIRVIDGHIRILEDYCIDCGECLRNCNKKAISLDEDDWEVIRSHPPTVLAADPTFFAQFSAYWHPSMVQEALKVGGIELIMEQAATAFDISALAVARTLEEAPQEQLPLISSYCPAVLRLIQMRFPELIGRIVRVDTPLQILADLWRNDTGRSDDITLLSPCPAKIALVREPLCRDVRPLQHVVSVRKVARHLMAAGAQVQEVIGENDNRRWLKWALRGGESKHVRTLCRKRVVTWAVSGLRNTIDLLRELELGRLAGVDFVECRVCDLGCIGGIATAESRFLASLRLQEMESPWHVTDEEMETMDALYQSRTWIFERPILPSARVPLSDNLSEAMTKLQEMKAIYASLPHIDCGSCGRPSCRAMAEDIVRGEGATTDCIFKLREGISDLACRIMALSKCVPNTLKGRGE